MGIDSHHFVNAGMDIGWSYRTGFGTLAQPVGRTYDPAPLDAASGKEAEHRVAPVIAPWSSFATRGTTIASIVHLWCTTKLATKDNEGGFQQSALLQILQKRGNPIIHLGKVVFHARFQIPVMIPSTQMDSHKAGSRLDKPTRQ